MSVYFCIAKYITNHDVWHLFMRFIFHCEHHKMIFDLCLNRWDSLSNSAIQSLIAHFVLCVLLHAVRSEKVLNELKDWVRWYCKEPYIVLAEFDHVLRKFTKFLINMLDYRIIGAYKIEWPKWATVVFLTSAKRYLNLIDAVFF